ncbi:hypothetical protein PspLS_00910 [Pyricularia sp. CBS 133598]|nr:hypothetical protein PspLS_00910 [Pyricularia sp. CBS 133598]
MAARLSLRVRKRSKKGGFKRLPESIELPTDATVEDVKRAVAKEAKVSDFNRIGVHDPKTNSILKDRKALVKDLPNVVSAGEVLVKDLGPQIGWRTVFFIEYFGPILFHCIFAGGRDYIYPALGSYPGSASGKPLPALTTIQQLSFALFIIHFMKREVETVFVHRFAANTMPFFALFRNCFLYWVSAGLACSFVFYAPANYSLFGGVPLFQDIARSELSVIDYLGVALFVYGELCNGIVHLHLANLRAPGTTEKGIPSCVGSSLVTCPNYMFEVIAWVGMIMVSRSWATVITIVMGGYYMMIWSIQKERALRQLFPDKYKKKRYTMLPGLV